MTVRNIKIGPKGLAGSLILGGLAGAGAALMFAPLSGKQTRQRIGDFAEDVKCKAQTYGRRASSKMTSGVQKGAGLLKWKKTGQ